MEGEGDRGGERERVYEGDRQPMGELKWMKESDDR